MDSAYISRVAAIQFTKAPLCRMATWLRNQRDAAYLGAIHRRDLLVMQQKYLAQLEELSNRLPRPSSLRMKEVDDELVG